MVRDWLFSRLDIRRGDKRRASDEQSQTPDEIEDPTTRRDYTTPTLWERAKESWMYFATLLSALIVVVVLMIGLGVQIVPELLENTTLHIALALIAAFGLGYVMATKRAYAQTEYLDWLCAIIGTEVQFYPGYYEGGGETESDGFLPIKGFTMWGHRKQPYTVEEINPDLARTWKAANRDPEDPARINLDAATGGEVHTDYGTIVGRWASDLTVDTFGQQSELALREPDQVDADQHQQLTEQLYQNRQRVRRLERQVSAMRDFVDNLTEEMGEPLDDLIDQHLVRAAYIANIGTSRTQFGDGGGGGYGTMQNGGGQTTGSSNWVPPIDQEQQKMEEIAEGLKPDDDE